MTMEERNELIDALNIIKKECAKHVDCKLCPMVYKNDEGETWCYLRDNAPNSWMVKEKERVETWRAFK